MHNISSAVRPYGRGHRALALVPLCLAALCVGYAVQGPATAIPHASIGQPWLAAAWPTPSLLPCRPKAVPPYPCRCNRRAQVRASALAATVGRRGARSTPRSTYRARLCFGALLPCRNGGRPQKQWDVSLLRFALTR